MNTDYYKLYKDNIFTLAKTLCIKSTVSADAINKFLMLQYGATSVNLNDPTTWKYYLNITGQYHSSDTMMFINSLDNGITIPFTKDSLISNPVTAASYVYGTKYYYNLLASYQNQEKLILGILYPADMTTAVNAVNGAILSYPTYLVEPQEETLIQDIEKWIQYMLLRWDVPAFNISDPLYAVAQHAILYMNLVPKIINLRLARCKTNEVHSFHIKQYLASHEGLDIYYDYLTLKQALFLYRNILYIERNPGTNDTLTILIANLLTSIGMPVVEYIMKHKGTFDSNYRPEYIFRPRLLNNINTLIDKKTYSINEILTKEALDGLDNQDYIDNQFDLINNTFKNSPSNIENTKILDSEMIDYTDYTPYTLTDALLNHWVWMSTNGIYNATVDFIDPTNGNTIILCAQDAFIYLMYITSMSMNITMEYIPTYVATRVSKRVKPTLAELKSVTNTKYFSDDTIANWILTNQPTLIDCESNITFYKLIHSVYSIEQQQLQLISNQNHQFVRGMVSRMVDCMYNDYPVTFYETAVSPITGEILLTNNPVSGLDSNGQPHISYTNWLASKGLSTAIIPYADCLTLMSNITKAAIGFSEDPTKNLANIQKAVIAIMRNLSSYSIQFVSSINSSAIIPLNWSAIRLGDISTSTVDTEYTEQANIEPIAIRSDIVCTELVNVPTPNYLLAGGIRSNMSVNLPLENTSVVLSTSPNAATQVINVSIATIGIETSYANKDNTVSMNKLIVGYENYLALTDTQKNNLIDIYQNNLGLGINPPTTNISDIILVDTLNPLNYTNIPNNTIN